MYGKRKYHLVEEETDSFDSIVYKSSKPVAVDSNSGNSNSNQQTNKITSSLATNNTNVSIRRGTFGLGANRRALIHATSQKTPQQVNKSTGAEQKESNHLLSRTISCPETTIQKSKVIERSSSAIGTISSSIRNDRVQRLSTRSNSTLLLDALLGRNSSDMERFQSQCNISCKLIPVGNTVHQRTRNRRKYQTLLFGTLNGPLEKLVLALLSEGADPLYTDADGNISYWIAAQYDECIRTMSQLLKSKGSFDKVCEITDDSDDDSDPNEDSGRMILRDVGDDTLAIKNIEHGNLLDMCIRLSQYKLVDLLLRSGMVPTNNSVQTPLMDFAHAYEASLSYFPNLARKSLQREMWDAIEFADEDRVAAVLAHGQPPDIVDDNGRTPLYRIIEDKNSSLRIVSLLLDARANPNARDIAGTPIAVFLLLRRSRLAIDTLSLLLNNGLDIDAKVFHDESAKEVTLFEFAQLQECSSEVLKLLENQKIQPLYFSTDHR